MIAAKAPDGSDFSCSLVTEFRGLQMFAADWDRLWQSNPKREIFGKFSWISAWWEAYGNRYSLLTPVVRRDQRIVGILPLILDGNTIRFLGYSASDYNDLICDGKESFEILASALRGLNQARWDAAELENLPQDSYVVRAASDLSRHLARPMYLMESMSCPTLLLKQDKQETLQDMFRKRDLRRNEGRLSKLGRLTFNHLDSPHDIQLHLESFYLQHIRRWAYSGIRSGFIEDAGRNFMNALVQNLDAAHELRLSVLELDGRPIAYHLGLQLGAKYISYKSSYDIDLSDYTPSFVLLRNLFKYIQDSDIDELDFTIGDESYKSRFTNHVNQNFSLVFFSSSLRSHIRRATLLARIRLQRSPLLLGVAKRIRSQLVSWAGDAHETRRRDGYFGLLRYVVSHAIRISVYSGERILVFCFQEHAILPEDSSKGIFVRRASLGEVADLALRYPEKISARDLAEARDRAKAGDAAFVAFKDQAPLCLIWVSIASDIAPFLANPKCKIGMKGPTAIVLGRTVLCDHLDEKAYAQMLRDIVSQEAEAGFATWAYCEGKRESLRREIEEAGFTLMFEMRSNQIFHWWRRTVVKNVGGEPLPGVT